MTFDPDHGAPPAAAPSLWRRTWDRMRSFRLGAPKAAATTGSRRIWSWTWRIVVVVLLLYYPVGAMIVEDIDDDPQFAPRNITPGESRAVATAADLVTREVDVHTWTPMMPFFMPSGLLDNMPNFQRGIMAALGRSQHRTDGPARPYPRLEPDRPRSRAGARLPERAAQHLDLAAQRLADAVGDLGAEIPRRPRQAARLQQAAGRRASGVRAPRRQSAGAARPHCQR